MTAVPSSDIVGPVEPLAAPARVGDDAGQVEAPAAGTPDLVGRPMLEAYASVRAAGLRMAVRVREAEVGPWGVVLEQSPAPGERIRRGSRLSVVVSGHSRVEVPDVSGRSPVEAADVLRGLGLRPIAIDHVSSRSVPPGMVARTSPRVGTLLPYGGDVLILVARGAASRLERGGRGSTGA